MPSSDPRRATQSPEGTEDQPTVLPPDACLPGGGVRSVWPWLSALPANLVVAIDGPARTGKNTAGELVAEAIGGVLVDSGRFYRALTKAAMGTGLNLDVPATVVDFCQQARLEARLGYDGGRVEEALVLVNGVCFDKTELNAVGADAPKLAKLAAVRDVVNSILRGLGGAGRVVVLGRDMGARVFPNAEFKFFFTAPTEVLELRQLQTTGIPGVDKRIEADRGNTLRAAEAMEIDTAHHPPAAVCAMILVAIHRRVRAGGKTTSTVAE